MGKAMKYVGPIVGAGELGVGAFTGNPMLAMAGGSQLLKGIGGLTQPDQQQGRPPSLSPTIPTQGVQPDLSSMLGSTGGGLLGSFSPSGGTGNSSQGTTFGDLGGGGMQDLLSMILQGMVGGAL